MGFTRYSIVGGGDVDALVLPGVLFVGLPAIGIGHEVVLIPPLPPGKRRFEFLLAGDFRENGVDAFVLRFNLLVDGRDFRLGGFYDLLLAGGGQGSPVVDLLLRPCSAGGVIAKMLRVLGRSIHA